MSHNESLIYLTYDIGRIIRKKLNETDTVMDDDSIRTMIQKVVLESELTEQLGLNDKKILTESV